jgi:spore coat protein U-like protein
MTSKAAKSKNLLRVLAACAALGAALSAQAATNKTATFLVSLNINADCSISATALDFGTAGSTLATTPIDHNTTLSVTCTDTTPYTIALDAGDTTGATISDRLLKGTGTQTVHYQLYTDAPAGTLWGDGTTGSTVPGTGTGSAQSITVYGRVPAQTIPAPGNYTATETATLTF